MVAAAACTPLHDHVAASQAYRHRGHVLEGRVGSCDYGRNYEKVSTVAGTSQEGFVQSLGSGAFSGRNIKVNDNCMLEHAHAPVGVGESNGGLGGGRSG